MKFTKSFVKVLKHFASINPNAYFEEGSTQTTIMTTNSDSLLFFVRAKTDMNIEKAFAIGDLSKFLSIVKLFNEPDVTITDKRIILNENGNEIDYTLSNPNVLIYEKNPVRFDANKFVDSVNVKLTKKHISDIWNMYAALNAEHISFVAADGKLQVKITTLDNPSSNVGVIDICDLDDTFKFTITSGNFMLEEADYNLSLSRKGVIIFTNETYEYFIPVHKGYSEI